MLLTYFIDLDPSPGEFHQRLRRYVADARPGIADAAATIQAAWARALAAPQSPALPLSEVLRTLGALVDQEQAEMATLEVRPGEVTVRVLGRAGERRLRTQELQQESAARQALRGQVPVGPRAAPCFEPLLRILGRDLEREAAQDYTIVVTPDIIGVEGSAGYYALFPVGALEARAHSAVNLRLHWRESSQ